MADLSEGGRKYSKPVEGFEPPAYSSFGFNTKPYKTAALPLSYTGTLPKIKSIKDTHPIVKEKN